MATGKKQQPKKRRPRYYTITRKSGNSKLIKTKTKNCRVELWITRKRGVVRRTGIGCIRINGRWVNIVIVDATITGEYGYYESALNLVVVEGSGRKGKKDSGTDLMFLDTLLHEVSHALDPKRAEKAIKLQGNVLSELVTAFGYKN